MKFSIIIPVAKKDSRYLKRALLSLQDQDLKDWEAIVVTDGFKHELPVEDKRIKMHHLGSSSGASKVRNKGASMADGEYLFFLDCDCVLFPGMLKLISDRFDQYKPDFVYSGYRFNHSTLSVFPSRPFDPFLIESMNYICTMSPMTREVFDTVGGFREDLPYFQDWDFWIRAIKDHGFTGHYLKDYMFQTEVPNRMSISGNGKHTWKEKVKKIENLNDIKKRDICVTTLSAPYQSIERAKVLDARYLGAHNGSTLIQLPSQFEFDMKAVVLQGFFPQAIEDHMSVFPEDCVKVINWIGTDVWQLRNKFNYENLKFVREEFLSHIDVQLCNSPQLQAELKEVGVDAEVVYQPLTEVVKATPLPKKPVVSAYCSSGHPLHSEYYIKDLAKAMPDVSFVLFGTALQDVQDENIHYMGFVPIQKAIDLSTIHIRITQHDGFPHTPIYFSMAGRRVLCNFSLKFCDYIPGTPDAKTWESMKSDMVTYIRDNINKPIAYNVKDSVAHYSKLCDAKKYKKNMLNIINKHMEKKNAKTLCGTSKS